MASIPTRPVAPTKQEPLVPKRARLKDLYVRSATVIITDEDGSYEEHLLIRKLNPLQYQEITDKANAARAVFLTAKQNPDTADHMQILGYVMALDRDQKIEQLVGAQRLKIMSPKFDELELEEPWKDGYIDGLREAWNGGLEDKLAQNPEDEEAIRVRKELEKFRDEAMRRTELDIDGYKDSIWRKGDKELTDEVMDLMFRLLSTPRFNEEFQRWEIFYATFYAEDDPEFPGESYFKDITEVRVLQPEVLAAISAEIRKLTVDSVEGKD